MESLNQKDKTPISNENNDIGSQFQITLELNKELYELVLKNIENAIQVELSNAMNWNNYWKGNFSYEELRKSNNYWTLYQNHEIFPFVVECINAKNYQLKFIKNNVIFLLAGKFIFGSKEKLVEFELHLDFVAKEKDQTLSNVKLMLLKINEDHEKQKQKTEKFEKEIIEEIGSGKKKSEEIALQINENWKQNFEKMQKKLEILQVEQKKLNEEIELKKVEMEKFKKEEMQINEIHKNKLDVYEGKILEQSLIIEKILFELKEIKFMNLKPEKYFLQEFGKTINVFHISNQDQYSPTTVALNNMANSIGVKLNVIEDWGTNMDECKTKLSSVNFHCILVSTWSSVNQEQLGNLLAEFLSKGVNIVIVLFANSTNYTFPKGKLESLVPLIPEADSGDHKKVNVIIKNNPLFDGNPIITSGTDARRANVKVSNQGLIDLAATWEDGKPLAAIR